MKLIKSSNKDITAKFNIKTNIKNVSSETNLEVEAKDRKKQ